MAKRARDADEFKKKKMARLRFRNLIRSVVLNRIWLEDSADQKLSLNVKKNIALLVRTQRKIGLLTMAEKSLIRTHHSMRTVEERKKLVSLMAGLNCFNKIPPKIRARLSKCVKFMVISPGRILIKEGQMPAMVYFLLTGEVEVSKSVFDHIQNCWVNRIEKICGSGDCLGDVELIEKTKRRHTYVTTNLVELLVVFEEDFERVLRPVMEQQWTEKKTAIMALDYFKFFTRDQIMSACKLCVLRQFEPLETIYYGDKGQLSYVHFVISGECMVLQCLKILMVSHKVGVKSLELSNITKEDSNTVFKDMSNAELLKIMRAENANVAKNIYNVDELIASDDNESLEQTNKIDTKEVDIRNLEIRCGLVKPGDNASDKSLKSPSQISEEDHLTERKLTYLDKYSVEMEETSDIRKKSSIDIRQREHQLETAQINNKKKFKLDQMNAEGNNSRKTIRQTLLGNSSSAERYSNKLDPQIRMQIQVKE